MTGSSTGRSHPQSTAEHWSTVWDTRDPSENSWFQAEGGVAHGWVHSYAGPRTSVIDIGAGASSLVDSLLARGVNDIAVLDISGAGFEHTRRRLGSRADAVDWIVADIRDWAPLRTYDIWHDRAVLHFLTSASDVERYVHACAAGVSSGGHAIISAFALDGPESCSGLPIRRYDAASLCACLEPWFDLNAAAAENHVTPWGATQSFMVADFVRTARVLEPTAAISRQSLS